MPDVPIKSHTNRIHRGYRPLQSLAAAENAIGVLLLLPFADGRTHKT